MIETKLNVLKRLAQKLNSMQIIWNVGASCMLYLRGIVKDFDDIDIMVQEQDALSVRKTFETLGVLQPSTKTNHYQTTHFYEFIIDGVDVDVMAGYKVVSDGRVFEFPLTNEQMSDKIKLDEININLASINDWLSYYRVMGRDQKVEIIEKYVKDCYERN